MKNRSQVLAGRFRFLRDTSAAVGLASVMLGSLVLVGAGSLGDMVWLSHQQNMLRGAVDAAGVAAFKGMLNLDPDKTEAENKKELEEIIKRYVLANVPEAYRESVKDSLDVKIKKEKGTSKSGNEKETLIVQIKAKRGGASPFVGVGGDDLIEAKIAVQRLVVPVDLVLAVDVSTGSGRCNGGPCGKGEEPPGFTNLKNATRTLITALYDGGGEHVAVGIVPYSASTVNIGLGRRSWVDGIGEGHKTVPPPRPETLTLTVKYRIDLYKSHPTYLGFHEWGGCVEHRVTTKGRDRSLDTHQVEKFPAYFYPWDYEYPDGPDGFALPWQHNGPQEGCPASSIVPLTAEFSAIRQAINEMSASDMAGNPSTAGGLVHLGVLWGRRVLAPSWQTVWGVPQPAARERRKILVVVTTGVKGTPWPGAYSAYGRPGTGPEDNGYVVGDPLDGVANNMHMDQVVENRFDAVTLDNCKLARQEGIQIYGVFEGTKRRRKGALKLLTDCTKSAANVFDSTENDEGLIGTFKEIGNKIGTIRRVRPPDGDI